MKLMFAAIAMLSGAILFGQKTIINDPNAKIRSIGSFSAIKISGGIDLYLSKGEKEAMAVSAVDVKFRDQIKTSVDNGVLTIWYGNNVWKMNTGNRKLKAYVSFRVLNEIVASGASDVFVEGIIDGDALTLNLSGASDFKGKVEVGRLTIEQSGASDATITGKAGRIQVEASGASDLKGYDLETENCRAKASGASDIKITVTGELHATANGASSIYYKGAGVVKESRSSGASSIGKRS
ncbi:MAG: head GIN domain-containing protein [Chitinophagaceae bacterium]